VAGEVLAVGCLWEVRQHGCEFSKLFLLAIRLTKDLEAQFSWFLSFHTTGRWNQATLRSAQQI
jgi:hypothetical protein